MSRIRPAVAALATVSLLLTTAACSSSDSSDDAKASNTNLAAKVPAEFKSGINVASGVYAPMDMRSDDGTWRGFDYDLGQALGKELGVTFDFQVQDFTSIIPSLQSGKHDIIMFGMNDTEEREKVLDYVDYFKAGLAILVKKGNPEGITTILDLCGKTVAVAKGTTQADFVKEQSAKCPSGEIKVTELPTENDAMLAVKSGTAVADVFDAAPAAYAARTSDNGESFEVVQDPANPEGYGVAPTGIGVLKKNSKLTAVIQEALQELIDDGTYKKLLDTYGLSSYGVDKAVLNAATKS